jgi:LmbE family N-acetylglucosaminyl deacetylase
VSVLVLSPHFDDAVLSCWHVLAAPGEVDVATIFSGLPPAGLETPRWDRLTGANDPVARVRERREEDRRALALAGREPRFLDFVERQYGAPLPSLEELKAATPQADEFYAPAGIGGHSAHELVRDLGLELLQEGSSVAFYAERPYATEFGWPAWVTGTPHEPYLDVDAHWGNAIAAIAEAGCKPRVIELDPDDQHRKVEAMRVYRTQFTALEAGAKRRLTHPELIRYEVVWSR